MIAHLELPNSWRQVSIAPDGDRAAQRRLLAGWSSQAPVPGELVTRLTRASRHAARAGAAFAAVLLASLDDPDHDDQRIGLSGSLTVGFRELPDTQDPLVAAEGTLAVLRRGSAPTRSASLVGLAGDPTRPAVLVRDQRPVDGAVQCLAEVLWLVPGSSQLAAVAVTTPDLPVAGAYVQVALDAAASLQVAVG